MKKILFLSGLLAAVIQGLAVPEAYCEMEEKGRGMMMGDGSLERLTRELDLSEAQQGKIKTIIDESKPEMEKLHEEMKAVMDKMRAAKRKTHETIRETLDLDQKEKFDAMSMKMRAMHQMRRGSERPRMKRAPPGATYEKKWINPPKDEGVEPMKNEWIEPENGSQEE